MTTLKREQAKAKKYKRLYDREVKIKKDFMLALAKSSGRVCDLINENARVNEQIADLVIDNAYLQGNKKALRESLERVNRLYIDTYNQLQESDAKRVELVRENNLLHDTLVSYKIPLHKKSWAELKHQFKSWVKQFDEK